MKRAFLKVVGIEFCIICFLLFLPVNTFGHKYHLLNKICFWYKGSWSSWTPFEGLSGSTLSDGSITLKKNGVDFFTFSINNYTAPTKAEIKQHRKDNTWFEYTGTVTYYVSDDNPTAEDLAKNNTLVQPNPRTDITPRVKRTTVCTINIAPYKEHPECYNIWFDNIGVGISTIYFNDNPHKGGRIAVNTLLTVLLPPIGWVMWIVN